MINLCLFFIISSTFFYCGECRGGALDMAQAVQEIVDKMTEQYKVIVINNCSNSIYLKCASADDVIDGKGSHDDWWTMEKGQALGWGFGMNNWDTTCFWCYANNNGKHARKTGKWYIHQNVWGWGSQGCPDAPAEEEWNKGVTTWEIRNDGAFSNMCADCEQGRRRSIFSLGTSTELNEEFIPSFHTFSKT